MNVFKDGFAFLSLHGSMEKERNRSKTASTAKLSFMPTASRMKIWHRQTKSISCVKNMNSISVLHSVNGKS